jgi:hypothetical protein
MGAAEPLVHRDPEDWARCDRCAPWQRLPHCLLRPQPGRSCKRKDILDDVRGASRTGPIIASLRPDLLERIKKFCKEKEIPTKLLESFSMGLNHAEVGALVAKKWNFPEQLVAAIRFHHSPLEAPEDYRDVVFSVYLANCIADLERERVVHDQLDSRVLLDFGITEEAQLDRIQGRLAAAFEQQSSRF